MDMYRSKLELSTTGAGKRDLFGTFDGYIESLVNSDDFINGYKPVRTYADQVEQIINNVKDKEEQVKLLYDFIKSHKKWNGDYGIWPDNESARFAFRKPEGDAADINMLLVSVLKSVGFDSSPILVSSKRNGLPITPSTDVFNYVIAGVMINGKLKLLDAANNKANFNMLPKPILNWKGILIKDNGSYEWVGLNFEKKSNSNAIVNAKIDRDLSISGSVQYRLNGYYASDSQEVLKNISNKKFLEFSDIDDGNYEIEKLTRKSIDTINHQSIWSYDFVNEYDVEDIGGKIYISPMLMFGTQTNPFKKEERIYPIDFGYPKINSHLIKIEIPDGYKVSSIPEARKIAMPQKIGSYLYNISVSGNTIQVISKLDINKSLVPIDLYGELRNFFNLRVEKEKETIVLEKI